MTEAESMVFCRGFVSLGGQPHSIHVNGHEFLPTGGQLMCPLVASKTAR
ncbi:hypothetical protein [Paenarthrobacter sp. NPDC018779]